SDEILFQLRRHPKVDVQSLDRKALTKLYNACQCVLKTAIHHHADPDRMPAECLLPHREGDGHCPRCGTELTKLKVSGRSAVICPNCQAS
ncbi:MAG: hypothetical protein JJ992_04020, partial [Planctomycetes bacterium]|nr:hypothetical protein [Planctomycetota bacterium]